MKNTFMYLSIIFFSTQIFAGRPYYLISHGIADDDVIAVYGWADNKKPCKTLEKFMNESMVKEKNYHRFSCVDEETAINTDCAERKDKESCKEEWKAKNKLLGNPY
ncbi:MAG: hypothetical protein HQK83_04630 [Fibrobacteria bacterium]|nr:hypothetical protein [Fibrobacteria bacterium]